MIEINRGAKRAFLSLVVKVDGAESIDFGAHEAEAIPTLAREVVEAKLIDSGMDGTRTDRLAKSLQKGPPPFYFCDRD